ncbi:MAG: helix-turn-helix domain-containing protein [Planctomycetes bacterium]|nr:helix-turn-helix domain-containing protein [Planctomycetota bacterium]MCH8193263.1 helix-turn-helix domain-containing protein [Planctomycetota bacterium]
MKTKMFEELIESVKEGGRITRGEQSPSRVFKYDALDVKKLRIKAGATQEKFAHMIGVSVDTVQNWEQGRRIPRGPARALLHVFEENPKAVVKALG